MKTGYNLIRLPFVVLIQIINAVIYHFTPYALNFNGIFADRGSVLFRIKVIPCRLTAVIFKCRNTPFLIGNSSVRKLVRCGLVAALYVVLCLALQPLSYGAVQVRVAEALCLLPVFGTEYILGVVLGCFLANLLGSTIVDVIFGTLATLLACLVTYRLRNIRFKGLALAASLPPVLFNAVIIGIEIAVMFPDPSSSAPIWLACITNGISVGIGELISCTVLGVLLVKIIESNTALSQIFGAE